VTNSTVIKLRLFKCSVKWASDMITNGQFVRIRMKTVMALFEVTLCWFLSKEIVIPTETLVRIANNLTDIWTRHLPKKYLNYVAYLFIYFLTESAQKLLVHKFLLWDVRREISLPHWIWNDMKWPTWCTITLYKTFIIIILYMFRTTLCSSSGGRIVLTLILLTWRIGWAHNNARK
jgi:hypothetical protein